MKKTIMFVVGMQCAGKTFLTGTLAKAGAQVVYIGEEIRKKIDVTSFENTENPYAPQISEAFAQEAINNSIFPFLTDEKSLLVIDSAPRNLAQYEILRTTNEYTKVGCLVVFIYEKYDVRLKRAVKKYDGKLSYFMKREKFENDWLIELNRLCEEHKIPIINIGEGNSI